MLSSLLKKNENKIKSKKIKKKKLEIKYKSLEHIIIVLLSQGRETQFFSDFLKYFTLNFLLSY